MAALLRLHDFAIPGRPDKTLRLDGQPLSIVDEKTFNAECDSSALTPAIGVATVLYNWCPEALLALLDTESWFSFTWTLTINQGEDNETKFEIGRIRQQVTMGTLEKEGLWKVMVTYDMTSTGHESMKCPWQPNIEETMVDDKNVEDAAEVHRLGVSFVEDMILHRRWLTGKRMRHEFFVESPHIGMDPWEDGMHAEQLHTARAPVSRETGPFTKQSAPCPWKIVAKPCTIHSMEASQTGETVYKTTRLRSTGSKQQAAILPVQKHCTSADTMASNPVNTPDNMTPNSMNASDASVEQPSLHLIIWQVKRNRSPYAILGLQPEATEREVTIAYRKLALLLHPDKCPDEKLKELHTQLFVKVDEAKDAILNPTAFGFFDGEEEFSIQTTKSPWRNPMFRKKGGERGNDVTGWEPREDGYYHWVPKPNKYRDGEPVVPDSWDDPETAAESQPEQETTFKAQVEDADGAEEQQKPSAIQVRPELWVAPSGKEKKILGRGEIIHAPVPITKGWEIYYGHRYDAHQKWGWKREKLDFTFANAAEDVNRAEWWEEDGPAMFAEEEAELALEHEDILEEYEIPRTVPFNLGDWLPDS
ncbi:hypothetical protein CBER1_05640 [Cercospora berteroae]|uniref:J domain-containing protein n=1 Tax=Cercospora berteroae TaxID=357750 RepID=A0A2S6C5H0_9PEZI|nr:hypothetical protein CBER1_05640 [Cercospora berteroae]